MRRVFLIGAAFLSSVVPAPAADCDFGKKIGSCTGRIKIDSTGGKKPSYSAEITVSSSAATCSKVEYYLDNTPHQTILRSSNNEGESLSSTKPIGKKNIDFDKCTAYLDRDLQGSSKGGGQDQGSFAGRWYGSVGFMLFKAGLTLDINPSGSGVSSSANDPDIPFQSRISGNRMTYTYNQPIGGEPVNVTLTMKSKDVISYAGNGSGITMSGTLKRQ